MLHHVIQKVGADPIHAVVVERKIPAALHPDVVGTVTLGFKFEKPDIIRDALGQPAGGARTIAPTTTVLLDDMHDLVNECADGFPIEFATKPGRVGSDPRAAGRSEERRVGKECRSRW